MNDIILDKSGVQISTRGLVKSGQGEIRIAVDDSQLLIEAEEFVRFLVDYLGNSQRKILDGESFAYGYWLVKFVANDEFLDVWEYNAAATDFVRGASRTLTYWRDQNRICNKFGGRFTPPRPDRLTVVDDGVFEGLPAQGVRYPSPEHMSGWWITTEKYNGDVSTLRREHTYHVTAVRPDLAAYVALPFGFRFSLEGREPDAWLDEKVAGASSV